MLVLTSNLGMMILVYGKHKQMVLFSSGRSQYLFLFLSGNERRKRKKLGTEVLLMLLLLLILLNNKSLVFVCGL